MKIEQVMTQNPVYCDRNTNLAAAAMMMWDHDCGVIPVVGDDQKVVGVITDRDICMALATKHRRADDVLVGEVIHGKVHSCFLEDDAKTAIKLMNDHQVRRLPVIDKTGILKGVVSMNDLVLEAKEGAKKKISDISFADIVRAMKSICSHKSHQLAA